MQQHMYNSTDQAYIPLVFPCRARWGSKGREQARIQGDYAYSAGAPALGSRRERTAA